MARAADPRQKLIHRLLYAGIAIVLVGGIALMLAQQTQSADGTVSLTQLEQNLGQDPYHYIVIDVRMPDEYRAGHVPYAMNIPIDQLGRRLGEFESVKDRQFALICESGNRSEKGVALLRQAGFKSVAHVPEGMRGWRESGRRVVTE
jgi:rhodanese-related sulfurtransferase